MKLVIAWIALIFLADLAVTIMVKDLREVAESQTQTRIDTFDKNSNRTGHAIVDPKTGRIDFYDKYSNRTGSGQITPPPQPQQQAPLPVPCPRPPCR